MKLLFVCLALDLFLLRMPSYAQATVDESLETATLYVDTAKGSDSNPGTAASPFKTISAAVSIAQQNNQSNIGTKVIINPGTYRESVAITPNSKSQTAMPMTLQAATNGTVFVSGAVQYTGWAPYALNPNIYFTVWANRWGLCPADDGPHPFEPDIVNRREMIVVNGTPLTQVLTLSQMVYPGTFSVDETAGLVYVWPPSGTNMLTADVEVPTNPNPLTIQSQNGQTLNGIVLRGLTFEYGNPCHKDGAVVAYGQVTNLIFDSDTFQWNNGHGLNLTNATTNATVLNSVALHNGAAGFNTFRAKNVLWQNVRSSYNNWRGAQGAYYTWNTAGMHIFSDHTDTISGATITFNQTKIIHWDTDNTNVTADSVFAANNMVGVFMEKDQGPVTISNGTFCNSIPGSNVSGGGLMFRNSENVTATGNTWYNTGPYEVVIVSDSPNGIQISNWETGQVYNLFTQNETLTSNVFEDVDTGQSVFNDPSNGGTDWTLFLSTLKSDYNTWWDANNTTPFIVATPAALTQDTFAQWQSVTGQDAHSTFAAPATDLSTKCTVSADTPDFWLLSDSGQEETADNAGVASFPLSLHSLGGLTGTVNLWVDLSSIPGATATFSPSSLSLPGSSNLDIVTPSTTAPGTYMVMVLANTGNITRTLHLAIVVPSTGVRLSTSSLDFGNVTIGVTSPTQTVTLTNTGSKALSITNVTTTYGFSETNTCGTSLAAGKSCSFSVTFAPNTLTTYDGSLTVTDSDGTSPQKVSLTGVALGAPVVALTPQSLSFSSTVYLSSSASKSISVQNTGTADLHVSSITVTGTNPSDFTQTNTCSGAIAVGSSCTITVTFTPHGSGSRSATISIADDAVLTPKTASVTGTETAAITISPKSATFASTVVGSPSAAKAITVTNGSAAAIPMTSFSFTGTNPSDFTQTNTCGSSLAGGATCTVNVTFTPGATGTRSGTLSISDGDPASPQSVTLTGTGTSSTVTLSPSSLSFGNQVYLKPSTSQSVTLTNSASTTLTLTSISVTGTNPGDFTQTNTCGSSVKSKATCTITVTFDPTALGARSALITIKDNASGSPQNISVSGTGTTALTISPASLTFASQAVGTTSPAQTVTITNGSTAAIAVTSLSFSGANATDFAQTNTCGSSLAGSASCTVNVTFTPSATGTRSATLSIADGDPASPQTVALSGTGSAGATVVLSPASLSFGSLAYLKTSNYQNVTLTNSGSAALTITSITLTGINATDFTQKNNCGTSVAAGGTCSIAVSFTPQGTGTRSASMSVADSASGSPQLVSLSGTGTTALTVSPSSLTFASTPVGTTSAAQTVTVTNGSTAAISIGTLTFSGTNAHDFSQTNTCGTSLNGGASCTISVTFKPAAKGTRTGTLSISDGDPASPQLVTLTGTGS